MQPELWPDQRTPALQLVERDAVHLIGPGHYEVGSLSTDGTHDVSHAGGVWGCDCLHHLTVGRQCVHILAVRYCLGVGREVNPARDWSAYNAGTTAEADLFDSLLAELVESVEEPPRTGPGRPSLPLREQVFCAVKKAHSQQSSRRAVGIYRDAAEEGILGHAPHFNAVSKFLNREGTYELLRDLVRESAAPLAGVEMDFAVDSTGFGTSRSGDYCISKHGGKKRQLWVKAHAIVGVQTCVVADVIATDGHSADVNKMPDLVAGVAQRFHVGEVSADKAYSARYNHDAVEAAGGVAYIPFKKGAKQYPMGSTAWKKAFLLFQAHEDEFKAHYHKRSNVESAFGALKAKFGERVKSKTLRAQQNEVLCKVLAYNITVLIRWMHEANITLHLAPRRDLGAGEAIRVQPGV